MDKNTKEMLAEIQAEAKELNARIEALKAKIAQYEAMAAEEAADVPADFTDIELSVGELPEPIPVEEPAPVIEAVEEDLPEAAPVIEEPAPVIEAPAPVAEPEQAPAPKPKAKAKPEPAGKPFAWMLDVPQVSVKNIRSAISLQDRALFIKTLFKEDFALYDSTISALNAMDRVETAADYIKENFPDWNLRSDVVYDFMMAVRKKLG